jgi:hypothetical protein
MPDPKRNEARDKAIADAKARQREAVEGQDKALIEAEPQLEGYDETQPGQTEIVAGSVEHQQVLNAYPNATSYASDVNVIVAPEPEVEQPPPEGGVTRAPDKLPESTPRPGEPREKPTDAKSDDKKDKK